MEINQLILIIKKKLEKNIVLQNIKIEDKSFLHKKHLSNQEGKYHLRLSIKSLELKKQNKVQAYKKVYNIYFFIFDDSFYWFHFYCSDVC